MSSVDFPSPGSERSPASTLERGALPPALNIRAAGIIFNPISGQGSSPAIASQISTMLERQQIRSELIESRRIYDPEAIQQQLKRIDLAIVVGGDGTMMGLLPHLAASGTPTYMVPSGNESLFSRAFSMRRELRSIEQVIRGGHLEEHSYATVNGVPYFTMASVGIDSVIVSMISKTRTGPIGHIGYVLPTLQQLAGYIPPRMSFKVDGREVVSDQPGYLIVANSPHYALGLNLVPEADSRNSELCARFFPGGDVLRLLTIATGRFCGFSSALEGSLFFRGRRMEVSRSDGETFPAQADGEAVGGLPLDLRAGEKRLKVLCMEKHPG